MNVATIKTVLFLVSLGLFGGLGYFAYQHKTKPRWSYWDKAYAKAVLDTVVRPETPEARIVNYDAVVTPVMMRFDWTGAPPKKVEEAAAVEAGPVVKPKIVVSEILAVLYTQVDTGNPGGNSAFVNWLKPELKGRDSELRIGEKLPAPFDSALVKDIRTNEIEFAFAVADGETPQENELVIVPRNADVMVVVDGEGNVQHPKARRLFPTATPDTNARPKSTRRLAQDLYEFGEEDLETFATDYPRILTEDVRLETHYDKDGKRAGLKISDVKAGSIASQHGAQSGDVIISINGHPVSSEQEAIKFVKNNADTTTVWQVVVETLGRQRTVTYNSPGD
jgi:hypothetical protein